MVAILEAVLFVKPEWSYSQAHAHWHAFSAKLQLPGAAKAHMPKRSGDMNNRQPAPMLAAEVPILANVFMSLPNSCPQHLCECAAALYRHYNMESPTAFVYEPIASCTSSKTPQNDHQLPVATAVQGQSVANACLPVMASSMAFPALASAIVPRIQSGSTSVAAGRPSNVSLALAAAMPQNAVAQIGHVFQNSTFCLRALQDVNGTLWFKGNEVAATLGYEDLNKAVRTHVHIDRRCKLLNLQFSRGGEMPPPSRNTSRRPHGSPSLACTNCLWPVKQNSANSSACGSLAKSCHNWPAQAATASNHSYQPPQTTNSKPCNSSSWRPRLPQNGNEKRNLECKPSCYE